jgi:hypothetical protein
MDKFLKKLAHHKLAVSTCEMEEKSHRLTDKLSNLAFLTLCKKGANFVCNNLKNAVGRSNTERIKYPYLFS